MRRGPLSRRGQGAYASFMGNFVRKSIGDLTMRLDFMGRERQGIEDRKGRDIAPDKPNVRDDEAPFKESKPYARPLWDAKAIGLNRAEGQRPETLAGINGLLETGEMHERSASRTPDAAARCNESPAFWAMLNVYAGLYADAQNALKRAAVQFAKALAAHQRLETVASNT